MIRAFLAFMQSSQAPWEAVFFDHFADIGRAAQSPRAKIYNGANYAALKACLQRHEPDRPERLNHPYFKADAPVHLTIETVEGIWAPIADEDDWSALDDILFGIRGAREAYDLGAGRSGFLRSPAD